MATEERKYTARDLYIASVVGVETRTKSQAGTKEDSWKEAAGAGRNQARDEAKVANFEKQFDAAMKVLDVEEAGVAQ